jgi:hypothetical protein
MIVNNHWSLDFLLKNPRFKLQDNIYVHNDKHTIIFYTNHMSEDDSFKLNMYQFIMKGYILDDKICIGECYFCEFESDEMYKFYKNDLIHHCCKECTYLWKVRENVIKLSDNLYQFNNSNNVSKLQPDYIYHQIMYCVLYTPIDKFSYDYIKTFKQLVELKKNHPLIGNECDLCTYNMYNSLEDEDWYGLYICDNCISYSIQIIIQDNYPKYMLEKCLFDIEDMY